MNKILFILIICGTLGFLSLIPGVMDNAIYYYYRAMNGKLIKLDNKCYSIPDGWFIHPTEDIDNSSRYSFMKKGHEKYEITSIFRANKEFQNRIQNSALLKQIDSDFYSIYKVPGSLMSNMTRYWLVHPNDNLVIGGRTVSIVESFSEELHPTNC